ncbi:MAG: glucosaminidase domain-containing protein [Bacteroidales bacterium]|nr:glucosaminidase domain-containing protein [Bacteroidales bacterium]
MEQQLFVESLLPVIDQVNSEISTQRKGISTLYREFKTNNEFPQEKTFLIYNYLKLYRCDVPPDSSMFVLSGQHFKELLKRVDIIPRKLVLAQAAIESNWGTSRFTIEGNNYFGIRCTREGCGISPKKATGFYVKKYPDLIDSVRDYMRLLNSGKYYESFRDLRIVNRLNTDLPDPFYIVKGLEKYSSRGKVYINNLILIMKSNFYYL